MTFGSCDLNSEDSLPNAVTAASFGQAKRPRQDFAESLQQPSTACSSSKLESEPLTDTTASARLTTQEIGNVEPGEEDAEEDVEEDEDGAAEDGEADDREAETEGATPHVDGKLPGCLA